MIRLYMSSLFFMLIFTSCAHKNIDGTNDFSSMISNLVENSYTKLNANLLKDDVVLVSDFVNIDKLKNHSKLGFLLSETLKNSLSAQNIVAREVELGKNFKIGEHGFNILSRKDNEINNVVENERFAVVGTYSITTKKLILFIKLIDINNGSILSSSSTSVSIDNEILELERTPDLDYKTSVYQPLVL